MLVSREYLKDSHGRTIGSIETNGSKSIIKDEHGRTLGSFDGRETKDAHGRTVGKGNLLTMLLNK